MIGKTAFAGFRSARGLQKEHDDERADESGPREELPPAQALLAAGPYGLEVLGDGRVSGGGDHDLCRDRGSVAGAAVGDRDRASANCVAHPSRAKALSFHGSYWRV